MSPFFCKLSVHNRMSGETGRHRGRHRLGGLLKKEETHYNYKYRLGWRSPPRQVALRSDEIRVAFFG
jgi:hypothetical protein